VQAPTDKPRRSVYLQARRSKAVSFLTTFDAPGGELNCERRISSTAAPQALMLMNNDFILQEAGHFAVRLSKEMSLDFAGPKANAAPLIDQAWLLAYQRPASSEELDRACRYVAGQTRQLRLAGNRAPELAALTNLCQQLLASNEFLYVD
jgi:Protein of unknown function (DUF1553)